MMPPEKPGTGHAACQILETGYRMAASGGVGNNTGKRPERRNERATAYPNKVRC
jgi:hypothetical protein